MKTAYYNVTGMSCAACASSVEKALNRNEGIEARVNIATEKVHLEFDDSKYDFKSKSNEVIMADVVKAEYPNESFKDSEIGVVFKMLKEKEEQVQSADFNFTDTKAEIIKAFNEEIK